MILTYHKVSYESPSKWWVDLKNFYRQMLEIRNKKIVYLDEYNPDNPNHVVITIDDGYKNTLQYAVPILNALGYPFEVFVIGNYIGGDSSWDNDRPITQMCTMDDLKTLVQLGARLEWHTNSHPKLNLITDKKTLLRELKVPKKFFSLDKNGFRWFAYPYGIWRENSVEVAKKKFKGAVSCTDGDNENNHLLIRVIVTNETILRLS